MGYLRQIKRAVEVADVVLDKFCPLTVVVAGDGLCTILEWVEFAASDYDSPAAFLKDRNGVHPASFDDPGEYQKAMAERGEQ